MVLKHTQSLSTIEVDSNSISSTEVESFKPVISVDGNVIFPIPLGVNKPAISSDSEWLAYTKCNRIKRIDGIETCSYNIVLVNLETYEEIQLFPQKQEQDKGLFIAFSPNNKYLAIISIDSLWLFDIPEMKFVWKKENKSKSALFSWNPNSNYMAIESMKNGSILSVIDIAGNIEPILLFTDVFPNDLPPTMQYAVFNWGPTWSPDGNKIAYIEYNDSFDRLWEIDLKTGIKNLLCQGKWGDTPLWSPNGREIILMGSDLTSCDIQTHRVETLIAAPSEKHGTLIFGNYVWSPTGDHIALGLQYEDERTGVYIFDMNNREKTLIESGSYILLNWTESGYLFVEDLAGFFKLIPIETH